MTSHENYFLYQPRFHEFDGYGIVHHSAYFCWFEEGRVRLFENLGLTQEMLKKDHIQIVLQTIECQFNASIQNRTLIEVVSALELPVNGRLKFKHTARCSVTKNTYATATIHAIPTDGAEPTRKLQFIFNHSNERKNHAN